MIVVDLGGIPVTLVSFKAFKTGYDFLQKTQPGLAHQKS